LQEFLDFQNNTLRPNIKAKNDFIISIFINHKEAKSILSKNKVDKQNSIEKLLKSDSSLKNILIGAVISNFDSTELEMFYLNKAEYAKRIINICAKRIFDNNLN
jgi:hypothetical protein